MGLFFKYNIYVLNTLTKGFKMAYKPVITVLRSYFHIYFFIYLC